MKKSQISFKFKTEKNYDSIRFSGMSITLKELKTKIKEKLQDKNSAAPKENIKDKNKDDILVIDEITKQPITDESSSIPADKKVIIERIFLSQIPTTNRPQNDYSHNRVMQNDKSEFICKICKSQFTNPVLTRCCGDTACEPCLDRYIQQKNECPSCNKPTNIGSCKAGPNVKIQKLMANLAPGQKIKPNPPNPYSQELDSKMPSFKEIEKYLMGAKFFIIKSSNTENLQHSIKHSEWATTKLNELNNAFQKSKNVILIFSVNKSSQFQGYARMESPSSNKFNSWQGQESIKLGGTFKVTWLRICNVNFTRVNHMKNRFNNNEPIKKSRDTQEIPEEIGIEICKMFETPDGPYRPFDSPPRPYMPPPIRPSPPNSHDSPLPSKPSTPMSEQKSASQYENLSTEPKKTSNLLEGLEDDDFQPVYFGEEEEITETNGKDTAEHQEEPSLEKMVQDQGVDQSFSARETRESTDLLEQQNQNFMMNDYEYEKQSENPESQHEAKSELEKMPEEKKETGFTDDDQGSNRYDQASSHGDHGEHQDQQENSFRSVSQERPQPEEVRAPKHQKPPEELHKQPPPFPHEPPVPRPYEPVVRPPVYDRPPPPPFGGNMYPHAPPMRYQFPPHAFPPNPYGAYPPVGPYPNMDPTRMQMNNPYLYGNYYPQMWNQARPFPMDNKPKPEDANAPDEAGSQSSEDSGSSKKKDKKRGKKDKKKKKKSASRERSREKERERERSRDRDRDRSRDKSRTKSKSKSRRK